MLHFESEILSDKVFLDRISYPGIWYQNLCIVDIDGNLDTARFVCRRHLGICVKSCDVMCSSRNCRKEPKCNQ